MSEIPRKVAMSLPDTDDEKVNEGPEVQAKPEQLKPPVTEVRTPRDAVFLTEIQEIKARLDLIGQSILAVVLLAGASLALAYYISSKIQIGSGN